MREAIEDGEFACDDNGMDIKEKIDYCSVVEVEEQRGICRGLEPKTSLITW